MIDYKEFAFIFDMDGTLVDNMRYHTMAWQKMLDENGIKARASDFLINTAGKTNREIVPTIFPNAGPEEIARLGDRKEELYRELFAPNLRPIAGAVEFLESSRDIGINLAVSTAAPPANVAFVLDGLDLRRYFREVTNSADVKHGKPHPDLFLRSAEMLGIVPARCLVFEDALNGFEAAFRAGMRSIGVTTVNSAETIAAQPSMIATIDNFLEIDAQETAARYILEAAVPNF
ncbi:MAG TPA: HAD family phosphatase [Pyrinomonadaceae bacterium]|nr:HAD family phosphatase [Pyrinomonadaceae bacterium]